MIESNNVQLSQNWGKNVTFSDYKINGKAVDFQDLMVEISESRAVAVEGEVAPMSARMRQRNTDLEKLGSALADLTAAEATLPSDAGGNTSCNYTLKDETCDICQKFYGDRPTPKNDTKRWLTFHIQKVKSAIDSLNNKAQADMTRLQSIVDRRDESYSTATNLMTAISDTRANLIKNL